ncbi:hypothetical protein [Endothiovibrio diazotrophicus]
MNTLSATILSLPLLLAATVSQALSLKYTARDAQGRPATSEISVLDQSNGVYSVEITGGMPKLDRSDHVYIDTHFGPLFGQTETVADYAIYNPPALYLIANSHMSGGKVLIPSKTLFIFRFNPSYGFVLTTAYAHAYAGTVQYQGETVFPEMPIYQLIE